MPGNIKEIEAEIKECEGHFEKLKASLAKCVKSISETFQPQAEAETAKLNKINEELSQNYKEEKDLQRTLAGLRQENASYLKKISELEYRVLIDKAQIKELRDPKSKLRAEIKWTEEALKKAIESHKETKKKYKGDVTQLREGADDFRKEVARKKEEVTAKILANYEKRRTLEKDRSRAEDAVENVNKQLEEACDIAKGNSKMIKSYSQILGDLYDQLEEAKKK